MMTQQTLNLEPDKRVPLPELMKELGWNYKTVPKAYDELADEHKVFLVNTVGPVKRGVTQEGARILRGVLKNKTPGAPVVQTEPKPKPEPKPAKPAWRKKTAETSERSVDRSPAIPEESLSNESLREAVAALAKIIVDLTSAAGMKRKEVPVSKGLDRTRRMMIKDIMTTAASKIKNPPDQQARRSVYRVLYSEFHATSNVDLLGSRTDLTSGLDVAERMGCLQALLETAEGLFTEGVDA